MHKARTLIHKVGYSARDNVRRSLERTLHSRRAAPVPDCSEPIHDLTLRNSPLYRAPASGDETLSYISDHIESVPLDPISRKRFERDLDRVWSRLKHGEYEKADFTGNTFNVPDRVRELYTFMSGYVLNARTWQRLLSPLLANRKIGSVLDFCPGWSPKVEMGLWYAGYTGTITVVDRCADALQNFRNMLGIFEPEFDVRYQESDLFTWKEGGYDLVVANHILDDVALSLAESQGLVDLTGYYESEEVMRHVWRTLLRHELLLTQTLPRALATVLQNSVSNSGTVIVSQYPSYLERNMELEAVTSILQVSLHELSSILTREGMALDSNAAGDALNGFAGYFDPRYVKIFKEQSDGNS